MPASFYGHFSAALIDLVASSRPLEKTGVAMHVVELDGEEYVVMPKSEYDAMWASAIADAQALIMSFGQPEPDVPPGHFQEAPAEDGEIKVYV